jgi:hypothetical protein
MDKHSEGGMSGSKPQSGKSGMGKNMSGTDKDMSGMDMSKKNMAGQNMDKGSSGKDRGQDFDKTGNNDRDMAHAKNSDMRGDRGEMQSDKDGHGDMQKRSDFNQSQGSGKRH